MGYPLQEHQSHTKSHTETSTPDQVLHTTGKTQKEETSPDHSLDTADTTALAIMTCTEATPDHNNRTGSATIEAAQDNPIQHTKDTVTGPAMTLHTIHTTNPPCTTAYKATTLRTTADHIHAHPTNCQSTIHTKEEHAVQDHNQIWEPKNHTEKGK